MLIKFQKKTSLYILVLIGGIRSVCLAQAYINEFNKRLGRVPGAHTSDSVQPS